MLVTLRSEENVNILSEPLAQLASCSSQGVWRRVVVTVPRPLYDTMTMTMSEHACKVSRFTLTALIDQVI